MIFFLLFCARLQPKIPWKQKECENLMSKDMQMTGNFEKSLYKHCKNNPLCLEIFKISVPYPGCLSRIRFFPSRIQVDKIPESGSGSESKNLSIFNPKTVFKNKIRDVHLGSWLCIFFHPGSKSRG